MNAHLFVRAGLRSLRSLRGPGLQLPEAEPRARAAVVRVSIDVQHAVAGARQGGRHRGLGKRRAHDERVDGRRQVLFGHLRYIATSAFLFTLQRTYMGGRQTREQSLLRVLQAASLDYRGHNEEPAGWGV